MRKVLFLLSFFILSCAPKDAFTKRDQKRIDKIVDKVTPEVVLGYIYEKYRVKSPVVIMRDTVRTYSERTLTDTMVVRDTVYYRQVEKGGVQIVVRKVRDTLYMSAKCKDSIVYIEKQVSPKTYVDAYEKKTKVDNIKTGWLKFKYYIFGLLFLILLVLILIVSYRLFRRMKLF